MTAAVAAASEKAEPYADEAKRRGRATAAAVKGEVDPPKKGSKLKKLVVFGGLAGLGAFLFKKLKGEDSSTALAVVVPAGPRAGAADAGTPSPRPRPAAPR